MDQNLSGRDAVTEAEPAAPVEPPRGRGAAIKFAIRVAIGLAVIGVLVARSDLHDLSNALGRASPGYIVAGAAAMVGFICVGAVRWLTFLRPLGLGLPFPTALRMYFVGTFFNAFLPTGVGGDAYKAARLRKRGTLAAAFASVFLDRFAGVVALATIGIAGVLARLAVGDHSRLVIGAAVASVLIIVAAVALFVLAPRGEEGPEGRWGLRGKLRRTLQSVARGSRDPRAFRWGLVTGIVGQALALATHVALARALDLNISLAALAGTMVLAQVATTVPVTLNGLGFREATYVWSLGTYGIDHDAALAFAFLMLGMLLASSALGGVVYVTAGGEVKDEIHR
jgi:uncharacterized membrane protein YbhN (UPF0104 family)